MRYETVIRSRLRIICGSAKKTSWESKRMLMVYSGSQASLQTEQVERSVGLLCSISMINAVQPNYRFVGKPKVALGGILWMSLKSLVDGRKVRKCRRGDWNFAPCRLDMSTKAFSRILSG